MTGRPCSPSSLGAYKAQGYLGEGSAFWGMDLMGQEEAQMDLREASVSVLAGVMPRSKAMKLMDAYGGLKAVLDAVDTARVVRLNSGEQKALEAMRRLWTVVTDKALRPRLTEPREVMPWLASLWDLPPGDGLLAVMLDGRGDLLGFEPVPLKGGTREIAKEAWRIPLSRGCSRLLVVRTGPEFPGPFEDALAHHLLDLSVRLGGELVDFTLWHREGSSLGTLSYREAHRFSGSRA